MKLLRAAAVFGLAFLSTLGVMAQTPAVTDSFAPLEQWKNAVVAGDAAALKNFYSTDPAFQLEANKTEGNADADMNFWLGLKAHAIKIEIVRLRSRPDAEGVIFNARVDTGKGDPIVIADSTAWVKQGDAWRLRGATRTDSPKLAQPSSMTKNLYPDNVDARAEIKEAVQDASKTHKHILLVFGANWCYDCHVLDLAFHRPDFAPLMESGYEVVHVNIGDDGKKNNDLAAEYQVPLDKGVPALAVIGADGKLLVSQKNGEFENARGMTPETMLAFLNKWKPEAR